MTRFGKLGALFSILILIAACSFSVADESERYYELASALTKLSSAVEAAVRYEAPPADATDEQLLHMATAHDPGLLEPFATYYLDVLVVNGHAVLLVCEVGQTRGLLEDVGCSARLDRHIWRELQGTCQAVLDVKTVCTR